VRADAWISVAVAAGALVALIAEWAAPEVVLLVAVTGLMLLGILSPAEALGSFGSDALLSVAALFVVAALAMKRARIW